MKPSNVIQIDHKCNKASNIYWQKCRSHLRVTQRNRKINKRRSALLNKYTKSVKIIPLTVVQKGAEGGGEGGGLLMELLPSSGRDEVYI